MYFYYSPPYVLLFAGLFAGIASGIAFEATLKLAVKDWSKNKSTRTLANLRGMQLQIPFLGICGGICFFLSAGMQIFGFPGTFAYGLAMTMTLFIGMLVWYQLGQVLKQLEKGGSAALDLDSFV